MAPTQFDACPAEHERLLQKWLLHLPAMIIAPRLLLQGLMHWRMTMLDLRLLRLTANVDDDEASLDDEEGYVQKKHSKGTKRKTRQAKALEARKAPRTFLELLHEANLESLPPHVPSYWKAAVGPPSSTSRRHFCTVCGFSANYTCPRCGMRFCSHRCQNVHNDTRCLKFVA